MIGPFLGAVGFIWGYLAARQRGGRRLDPLRHAAVLALGFGLFGTLLGIALARFLGTQ